MTRDPRLAWLVLAGGMVVAVLLSLVWAGDRTFTIDEWGYLLQRSDWTVENLLRPTLGHLVAGGLVVYNLAFSAFGAESHTALTLITIAFQCLGAGLLYAYCSRRLGAWLALLPALLILFYGAGWEILISSATLPNQVAMASGLGALLALDRRDRAGDATACVLLAVSIASFTIGLAFAVGIAVRILVDRRPGQGFKRLIVVAAPLALYVAWFVWALKYEQSGNIAVSNVGSLAAGAFDQLSAALAGITGLFRIVGQPLTGEALEIDLTRTAALVFLLVAAVGWRIARGRPLSAAAWGSLALVGTYLALVALGLSEVRRPGASRYAYMLTVLLLLCGSDLLYRVRISRAWIYAAAAVFAVSMLANVAQIRTGGRFFEDESAYNRAELGSLELVRSTVAPDFIPEPEKLTGTLPFEDLTFYAYEFFDAFDRFGSPADTPEEILAEPEFARQAADEVLVNALGGITVGPPARGRPPASSSLAPPQVLNGELALRRGCLLGKPSVPGRWALQIEVPPGGLSYDAAAPPAKLAVGRFADSPSVTIPAAPESGSLSFPADDAPSIPWFASFTLDGPVEICPGSGDGR